GRLVELIQIAEKALDSHALQNSANRVRPVLKGAKPFHNRRRPSFRYPYPHQNLGRPNEVSPMLINPLAQVPVSESSAPPWPVCLWVQADPNRTARNLGTHLRVITSRHPKAPHGEAYRLALAENAILPASCGKC